MNSESSAISTRVAIVIRRTEEPSLNRSPAVLSGENYWMFVVAHAPPIGRLPIGERTLPLRIRCESHTPTLGAGSLESGDGAGIDRTPRSEELRPITLGIR